MSELKTIQLYRMAAMLTLMLLQAGCDLSPQTSLRVGATNWPGYQPMQLAEDLRYFKPESGVHFIEYSSTTQSLHAFRNGQVEAAAVTLDEALLLAEDILDLRVVMVMDSSHGADAVLGRPGLATLTDLRGRRVGYESTALGAYMLSRALDAAGLRAQDVIPVSVQLDEHEKAFTNGLVDAVVTFEPVRSRLIAAGAHDLFNSAKIPGEILDVLVVRQSFADENSEAVTDLLRGWFKALDYQKQSPDDAAVRMSKRLRLTPAQTVEAFRQLTLTDLPENRRLLGGSPPPLHQTAEKLGAVMLDHNLLRKPPVPKLLFDVRFLDRLGKE
jgi:NitT/TauT family transport system substrate-binding protein